MFVCIVERNGDVHIIDYYLMKYKTYYSVCEKSVKLYGNNTFAADNTFPGICKKCESIYSEMYLDDLNYAAASARTSLNSEIMRQCILSNAQLDTPQQKYSYSFSRGWRKLGRIRGLVNGRK